MESSAKKISLMEVGPRDGLQNEQKILSTEDKIFLVESLVELGFRQIECTSFVSPKYIPALADHKELMLAIKKNPKATYFALVPNIQGYINAVESFVDRVSVVISASEIHNNKNLNATTKKAFDRISEIMSQANKDSKLVRAYLSCSFGCPYEGNISSEKVIDLAKKLFDIGVYELAISDTIGIANPLTIKNLILAVKKYFPMEKIALHLHDTRGMALANIWQALSLGITSFDCAIGGMGGCPYAKGAFGNVASEDLVNMLESVGISTGIDLPKLCSLSNIFSDKLGKPLFAKMSRVLC